MHIIPGKEAYTIFGGGGGGGCLLETSYSNGTAVLGVSGKGYQLGQMKSGVL